MSQFIDSLRKKAKELAEERASINAKLMKLNARLTDLNGAIAGIESLLRVEGAAGAGSAAPTTPTAVTPGPAGSAPSKGTNGGPQLYTVLISALADGKAHAVPDLVTVAKSQGVTFGDKDPVKAVGFTLLGISRGKGYRRTDDGRYQRVS